MSGGLIEIITYGSQDLFLTGTPEITFFKVVYRRYTNFSVDSIRVNFDDPVGFGSSSSLTVPRIGDLAHKMYLEVVLPHVTLKRCLNIKDGQKLKKELEEAQDDYDTVLKFMKMRVMRPLMFMAVISLGETQEVL